MSRFYRTKEKGTIQEEQRSPLNSKVWWSLHFDSSVCGCGAVGCRLAGGASMLCQSFGCCLVVCPVLGVGLVALLAKLPFLQVVFGCCCLFLLVCCVVLIGCLMFLVCFLVVYMSLFVLYFPLSAPLPCGESERFCLLKKNVGEFYKKYIILLCKIYGQISMLVFIRICSLV